MSIVKSFLNRRSLVVFVTAGAITLTVVGLVIANIVVQDKPRGFRPDLDEPETAALIAALEDRGIELFRTGGAGYTRTSILSVHGHMYQLIEGFRDRELLILTPYASVELATEKASRVRLPHDPFPQIDFVAPPHLFQCGSLIALYLGEDAKTKAVFQELCGPEFAGADTPRDTTLRDWPLWGLRTPEKGS